MIKYDFGFHDLSKIFELPLVINSIKNKATIEYDANFAFQNDNNSVLKLNSKK